MASVQAGFLKNLDTPLDKGICVSLADSKEDTCIILLYEELPNLFKLLVDVCVML